MSSVSVLKSQKILQNLILQDFLLIECRIPLHYVYILRYHFQLIKCRTLKHILCVFERNSKILNQFI
jgi:hypothetical protein